MIKNRWLFTFLFVAAVLFAPCREAPASDIDGTWRIASGSISEEEYGDIWIGYLSEANPVEFSIRVLERSTGLYSIVLNNGVGIDLLWTYTEYPRGDDVIGGTLSDMNYLVKNTERNYSYKFTDDDDITYSFSAVLLDSDTLRLTKIAEIPGDVYLEYEFNLKRTGWDPNYYADAEEASGCSIGLGAWLTALLIPVIKPRKRAKK